MCDVKSYLAKMILRIILPKQHVIVVIGSNGVIISNLIVALKMQLFTLVIIYIQPICVSLYTGL